MATTMPGAGPALMPEYVEGTMLGLTCRRCRMDASVLTSGGVERRVFVGCSEGVESDRAWRLGIEGR